MDVTTDVTAPVAKKVPSERTHHGDTFVDHYEWLRDKNDPEVIAYLEGQNAFTETHTAQLDGLRKDIFGEIKSRTQETDMSVPSRRGRYWYYARTEEGKQYAIRCRCPIADDDDWTPPEVTADEPLTGEEILLDANVEAEGHDFFSLGGLTVSDDGNWLAYSTDVIGDERYTLRFKDLRNGELLDDVIANTAGGAVWSADAKHVFYQTVDDAWRPDTVWRHDIGAGRDDVRVFHEPDERFWVGMGSTRSDKYLMIGVGSKITTEVYVLAADDPTGEFRSVAPRVDGVEYSVEHAVIGGTDQFVIVHNDVRDGVKAENFAIDIAPVDDPTNRRELIAHDPERRIEDLDAFRDYLVLSYRRAALPKLAIADLRGVDGVPAPADFHEVEFREELCSAGLAANPEWATPKLRIGYGSFVDPTEVLDLDVATGDLTLLKRQPVLGGYDATDYVQTREWATAVDGTRIPLSIVRRKGVDETRPAPLLLYGYGSYETSIDPSFSVSRLSLLDRGVVFVLAHIRGGGEMGRYWYDNGKTLTKKNTFTDFVDAARHLVDAQWTTPQQMVAEGGSAGGLLMGAVANLAPELFNGVLASVPFVDALTSILDPSLPLTVIEWDEWGNPLHDPDVYAYMRSYSPYENVEAKPYPPILALTSLNDTRVLFTEAAKWVARLQELSTSDNPILLKTEMSAGHGGVSGRYKQWEEVAFELAWILQQTGAVSPPPPE
ncbi:prolyl oligopeptidase family serine peptidase [Gordonia sp. HNM0687]|uniref:Prolyl oligopeptidase family serine peptidase n=1 Tax=Gordonia mangrovi TaxID=2665643 RepID=A0A6L7GVJ2_9ACTN|nr:S9 family peptidase [Gordonia mangrovi]MXP23989.1 prolyl oligopeptidase family serine peptidase [Gordonia mangrovi]UVF76535.1 S9 family peptidase [Gordonia mangrovi]